MTDLRLGSVIDSNTSNQLRGLSNLRSMQCTALLLFGQQLIDCLKRLTVLQHPSQPGGHLKEKLEERDLVMS